MTTVRIFGPGASGTRFLTNTLRHYLPSPPLGGRLGLHHRNNTHAPYSEISPECFKELDLRVIFLYADPRNIFLSILKKDIVRMHSHMKFLGCSEEEMKDIRRHHIERNVGTDDVYRVAEEIDEFCGLENHFDSWLYSNAPFKIAFIKYEILLSNSESIADFVSIGPRNTERFCKRLSENWSPRTSNYNTLSKETRQGLDRLFGSLVEKQSKLPPFWIKEAK